MPNLIAAMLAALGVMVGSIGPWAQFAAMSRGATDGDGFITLILGLLAALALFCVLNLDRLGKGYRWIVRLCGTATLLGVLCAGTAVVDIFDVRSRSTEVFGAEVHLEVAWGLWVLLVSSILLTATAAILTATARRNQPSRRSSPCFSTPDPVPRRSIAPGARVSVVAAADDYRGRVGVVHAVFEDDGDGITVAVKFKGDRELYAYRRDELALAQAHTG